MPEAGDPRAAGNPREARDTGGAGHPAEARDPRWWRWLLLALAIVVVDQVTKAWVLAAFQPGEVRPLLPLLSLVLAFNTGAAFSFLAGASGWQRWLFTVIAIVVAAVIVRLLRKGGSTPYLAGLALILGGAIGNVWDRLSLGKVVDFVLVHYGDWHFPAFNVADSAITVGAILLILESLFAKGPAHPASAGAERRRPGA
jgi:signal peptidase II